MKYNMSLVIIFIEFCYALCTNLIIVNKSTYITSFINLHNVAYKLYNKLFKLNISLTEW